MTQTQSRKLSTYPQIPPNDLDREILIPALVYQSDTGVYENVNLTLDVLTAHVDKYSFQAREYAQADLDIYLNDSSPKYIYIEAIAPLKVFLPDPTSEYYFRIRSLEGSSTVTIVDRDDNLLFKLGNNVDNGFGVEKRLLGECKYIGDEWVCNLF